MCPKWFLTEPCPNVLRYDQKMMAAMHRDPLEHAYEAMTEAADLMYREEWGAAAEKLHEARSFLDQAEDGDLKDEANDVLARYWRQWAR